MVVSRRQRVHRVLRAVSAAAVVAFCLAACTSRHAAEPASPSLALTPDASWFECHGRFDCVVVYDANVCAERAVNARYAVELESWASAFLARARESRECGPDPESEPRAVCRGMRCEIADSNLDALIEYTR